MSDLTWQADTCIGHWHYKRGQAYKTAKKIINLLVDIVGKSGNLLLNFPLPASGELDRDEMRVLQGITDRIAVNGEGIYASRPWRTNGEGPAMGVAGDPNARFNEGVQPDLGAQDIRFTAKGKMLYAFVQGRSREEVSIRALGTASV